MLRELTRNGYHIKPKIKLQKTPITKPMVTFFQTQNTFRNMKPPKNKLSTNTYTTCLSSENLMSSHSTIDNNMRTFSPKQKRVGLKESSCLSTKDTLKSTTAFTDFNTSSKLTQTIKKENPLKFQPHTSFDNKKIIQDIKQDIIIPMQQINKKKRENSVDISMTVKNLKQHLTISNDELSKSNSINKNLRLESSLLSLTTKRHIIDNKFINDEIPKLRSEIEKITNEKNRLDKQKVIYQNKYDEIVNDIDDMKKIIKQYKISIDDTTTYNKNMQSAIVLIKKRNDETKLELNQLRQNNDNIGRELLFLYNKYKIKELVSNTK